MRKHGNVIAAICAAGLLGACGGSQDAGTSPASQCVDIPDGAYFQFIDGRLVGVASIDQDRERPPETARRIGGTLAGMGYPWLSLDWDGEIATIRGIAPSEAGKSDAFIAAKAAFEADPVAGPMVQRVVNGIEVRDSAGAIADRLTDQFNQAGLDWMRVDIKGPTAILLGTAPDEASREAAYVAGRIAILEDPDASEVTSVVVDGLSVEGNGPSLGFALAGLGIDPSVAECQDAFFQTMEGRNVEFELDEAIINNVSARLLDAATGVALLCKAHEIEIAGHTDSRGQDAYNLDLSQRRASAVRDYLMAYGVPAEALTARGYGETRPLDPAETPEAWEKNRRTEFSVRARF